MYKIVQRIVLIIAFICMGFTGNTSSAQNGAILELSVKPVMCIRKIREDTCQVALQIEWKSSQTGNYCLFNELSAEILECWENSNSGEHLEERTVTKSYNYWLANNAETIRLIEAEFSVLDVRNPERRKNRKRRHVWSVL